jgi:hypothetical protein
MKANLLTAEEIIAHQLPDGSWGKFHSLALPTTGQPLHTEQALRRLLILGLGQNDEPIRRAAAYLEESLAGRRSLPDRREKVGDWDAFVTLILATWLRQCDPASVRAAAEAKRWASVLERAFASGEYDHQSYLDSYRDVFGRPARGDRLVDFVTFYQLVLLQGMLTPQCQRSLVRHTVTHRSGIYYIYESDLLRPPTEFASRQTGRYLSALEILAGYPAAADHLAGAREWLLDHRAADGCWDLGPTVRDGVNFPLSGSWRNPATRRSDCTARIGRLVERLASASVG